MLESTPKLQRRLSRLKRARESQPDAQDSLRHPLQPSNSQLTSPGANAALTTPLRYLECSSFTPSLLENVLHMPQVSIPCKQAGYAALNPLLAAV